MNAKTQINLSKSISNDFIKSFDDEVATKFLNICNPCELECEVAKLLGKRHIYLDLEEAVLVDYYVTGIWWARKKEFSLEKFRGFVSLLYKQLKNISEKHMNMIDHLANMKIMIEEMDLFLESELKMIVDYFMICIYEPYKMYEFFFFEERCCLKLHGNFSLQTCQNNVLSTNEGLSMPNYELIFHTKRDKICEKEAEEEKIATDQKGPEETTPLEQKVEEKLMEGIAKEKIIEAIEEIFNELSPGIQEEIVCKLEERKNVFLNKVNVMSSLKNFKY